MRISVPAILALVLLAGCATDGPKPQPAAKLAVAAPRPLQPGMVRLAAPKAGDPKPVNAKGRVGKAKINGQEFIVVFDGDQRSGPLTHLQVFSTAPAVQATVKVPLEELGATLYFSKGMVLLPGSDLVALNAVCQVAKTGETDVYFGAPFKGTQVDCAFGGKRHRVTAVDMNGSGKIGDACETQLGKDGYLAMSPTKRGDMVEVEGQRFYFGLPFILDGALWTLVAGADGQIVAESFAGPSGVVEWKGTAAQKPQIRLLGKTTLAMGLSDLSAGHCLLPAGEYRLSNLSYVDGGRIAVVYGTTRDLAVVPGKAFELAPVTTTTAKVMAGPMNAKREVVFNFKMLTPEGANVVFTPEKGKAIPPGVRVLDSAGKEVYKGNFDYG
jgi:hypothetical protein